VAEHVAQPGAELVAYLGEAVVGGAAIRAGVAAVFDQRDVGARFAQQMIEALVDRSIEPVAAVVLRRARSADEDYR